MFKYKFYEFFNKEIKVLTIQFGFSKFLIGGFFSESSIINLCASINNKLSIDLNYSQKIDWSFFPFNINLTEKQKDENSDILSLKEIFSDLKVIIIPNFRCIISYILIYKLISQNEEFFKINKETLNKIMIYSTEPIIQFAHCYLNEFYSSFNSLLIKYTIKDNNNSNENMNEFLQKKLNFINNNDIENFLSHVISINYNEKMNYLVSLSSNSNSLLTSTETSSIIEKYISFELCSNGYELGSSNILFHFYNKTIFVMTKSSTYDNRYPKIYDSNSPKNCDYLLVFPDMVNSNSTNNSLNYLENFKILLESLLKVNDRNNFESIHKYPYFLILTDPFFMLEYCDTIKFKLKSTKIVYFSKSVKSLFKYSNVSLGFLNDKLVSKIENFNMPFSFGDLEKEKSFIIYNDIIEFQNQLVNITNNNIRDNSINSDMLFNNMFNSGINQNTYYNKKNRIASQNDKDNNYENNKEFINGLIDRLSPFCFISHYFATYSTNNMSVFDFFMNNYDIKYDKIIIISNNSNFSTSIYNEIKNKLNTTNINFENYVLDYRIDPESLKKLIKIINPKVELDNQIVDQYKEINIISNDNSLDDNIISYDNCYLLSNNNKGIKNQLVNYSELSLDFNKEQLRYNITLDSKNSVNNENKNKKNKKKKDESDNSIINVNNNDEPAPMEQTEEILGKYLEMNNMEITEYLSKENSIEIAVFNKLKKTYTEIKINNYCQDNNIKIVISNNDFSMTNDDVKEEKKAKNKGKKGKSKEPKNKDKDKEKEKEKDKDKDMMDIEEEKKDDKVKEEICPSIEINSEDTEDSIFLNSLLNSIFV